MLRDEWRVEALAREPVVTYSRRPSRPASFPRAGSVALATVQAPSTYLREQARSAVVRSAGVTVGVLGAIGAVAAGVAFVAATFDATVLQPRGLERAPSVSIPVAALPAATITVAPASTPVVVASIAPSGSEVGGLPLTVSTLAAPQTTATVAPATDSAPVAAASADAAAPLPQVAPPTPRIRPLVPPLPRVAATSVPVRHARTQPGWYGQSASGETAATSRSAPAPFSLGGDTASGIGASADDGGTGVSVSSPGGSVSIGSGGAGSGGTSDTGKDNGNGKDNGKGNDNGKDVAKDDNGKGHDDGGKGGKQLGALAPQPSTTAVASNAGPRRAVRPPSGSAPIPPALLQVIIANRQAASPAGQTVVLLAPGPEVGRLVRVVPLPARPRGPVPPLDVAG